MGFRQSETGKASRYKENQRRSSDDSPEGVFDNPAQGQGPSLRLVKNPRELRGPHPSDLAKGLLGDEKTPEAQREAKAL